MMWKRPAKISDRRVCLQPAAALFLFTILFLSLFYNGSELRNLVARGISPTQSVATASSGNAPHINDVSSLNAPTTLSDLPEESFSDPANVATENSSEEYNSHSLISKLSSDLYNKETVSNTTESALTPPSGRKFASTKTKTTLGPRVAICLVGGARRFELTGSSLLDRVVNAFDNSDLFLNSPLDKNSYKLSLLKGARQIAAVRIAKQNPMPETEMQRQFLHVDSSPNGLQGLLQYFQLVEGCLTLINEYQAKKKIRYDWIVRTRVDGFWSAPLTPAVFVPGTYVVPSGSSYGGLNDRFGAGDMNTSIVALSRLSLIPQLFVTGHRRLNSECSFRLQLETLGVRFQEIQVPFCVLSEHLYAYPPSKMQVPVASMTSRGPLSGAYCRPCRPACKGACASAIFAQMDHHFNWIDGDPDLCESDHGWEVGWEKVFDRVAGAKYASDRKRVGSMDLDQCIVDLEAIRSRVNLWDAPQPLEICGVGLGLGDKQNK